MGSFKYKNQVNGEFFAYLWVILLYLSQESTLDSSSVGIWSSQFVLNLTDVTQLSNRSLRVFSKQISIKVVKYEDGMLIFGQNDIFCGYNVVQFSVWFLQLTVFKYLVASHVTEPGSLLTEPCAVIKFSHFSSHPGTCMLWFSAGKVMMCIHNFAEMCLCLWKSLHNVTCERVYLNPIFW